MFVDHYLPASFPDTNGPLLKLVNDSIPMKTTDGKHYQVHVSAFGLHVCRCWAIYKAEVVQEIRKEAMRYQVSKWMYVILFDNFVAVSGWYTREGARRTV